MCCFSGPVREVSQTRIFARGLPNGRQFIAYQMHLAAARDLAMILPLPVKQPSQETDVRFFNFEAYPDFFDDINSLGYGGFKTAGPGRDLDVQDVGAYDASFVPTLKDFERLDERFRLHPDVWKSLPQYADFGFAVFKLKPGDHGYHPMVFDFPRRNPEQIFFPTVHIHDEKVHETAEFDHSLYLQTTMLDPKLTEIWKESKRPANDRIDAKKAAGTIQKAVGMLELDQHVYRAQLKGVFKNQDVLVGAG